MVKELLKVVDAVMESSSADGYGTAHVSPLDEADTTTKNNYIKNVLVPGILLM